MGEAREVGTIHKIGGQTEGLKPSELRQLERLFRRRVPTNDLLSPELADQLVAAAHDLGRSVGVLVARTGHVTHVLVGGQKGLPIPVLRKREAAARLSGWRAILARPEAGGPTRDELVALAMQRLDALVVLGAEKTQAHSAEVSLVHLRAESEAGQDAWAVEGPMKLRDALDWPFEGWLSDLEASMAESSVGRAVADGKERALLISLQTGRTTKLAAEESLAELAELARTAGAEVVGRHLQKKDKPDGATFIGSGKVDELALASRAAAATLVVVDAELAPSQQANLEDAFGLKVIDRTALILDIFAQRAQTREGKLQVELAQLKYALPRVRTAASGLSRQGGGIGSRGPGETRLEVDRRRIHTRIAFLEKQVDDVKRHRDLQRRRRQRAGLPQVAIMGYTNAGKSTLLNTLTRAGVLAEDKLFATLDPVTRQLMLPSGRAVLLTDTVGFIQNLPTTLVAAFRATLEEVSEADVLLHVVDASHPNLAVHLAAVASIVEELGASDRPMVTALNKVDRIEDRAALAEVKATLAIPVEISAHTQEGLETLMAILAGEVELVPPETEEPPPPEPLPNPPPRQGPAVLEPEGHHEQHLGVESPPYPPSVVGPHG